MTEMIIPLNSVAGRLLNMSEPQRTFLRMDRGIDSPRINIIVDHFTKEYQEDMLQRIMRAIQDRGL